MYLHMRKKAKHQTNFPLPPPSQHVRISLILSGKDHRSLTLSYLRTTSTLLNFIIFQFSEIFIILLTSYIDIMLIGPNDQKVP